MAVDLVEIARLRDDLIKGRLSGVRSFRDQNGEEVTYKSDAEVAQAIAAAERLLAGRHPTTIRFRTSKGL